jgi:hypothetical protein
MEISKKQTKEVEISIHTRESGVPIYATGPNPIQYADSPPQSITSTKIEGVPGAFMLHHILSKDECDQYIDLTEKIGYADAPITTSYGMVMRPDIRNNMRVMWQSTDDVWKPIWERIQSLVPSVVEFRGTRWRACSLNERLRFYRYEPGQEFKR